MSESGVIEKSVEAARQARLRYVTDDSPGITRKRAASRRSRISLRRANA